MNVRNLIEALNAYPADAEIAVLWWDKEDADFFRDKPLPLDIWNEIVASGNWEDCVGNEAFECLTQALDEALESVDEDQQEVGR